MRTEIWPPMSWTDSNRRRSKGSKIAERTQNRNLGSGSEKVISDLDESSYGEVEPDCKWPREEKKISSQCDSMFQESGGEW